MNYQRSHQRLVNTCRWSSSREATFTECKKKYWYSYYGAWEGWPKTPFDTRTSIAPLASYLYRLKNIQPASMFIGSLVHKVIEETLRKTEHSRTLPPLETLIQKAVSLFDTAINDSKNHLWKKHPKHHTNLFEHYYKLPLDANEEEPFKEKIKTCLNNWFQSKCIQNLALDPKAQWMGIESTQTFALEPGIEAIVVYDFFLQWQKADGSKTLLIFDWKTGKENSKIDSQLYAYALAATTLFSTPLQSLIISPFYLLDGPLAYKKYGFGQEFPIDENILSFTKERILVAAKKMLSLHPQADAQGVIQPPDPSHFLYPEDRRSCRRCPFQELCMKVDFQPKSYDELAKAIPGEPQS